MMLRFNRFISNIHKRQLARCITSSAIERPHSHAFYDDQITNFASKPIKPVTLKQLVRYGQPPLSNESLEACIQYTKTELPVRLARRVRAFQSLPFIVGTNPYIKEIYNLYYDSFDSLVRYASPHYAGDDYIDRLKAFVERHSDNIPTLARGFLECKQYMNTQEMVRFLDDMIHARIGIRLIAEQAIALKQQTNNNNSLIGIIDTRLQPHLLIKQCADFVAELCEFNYGQAPEAIINGHHNFEFTYIPVHLEYILTELLKNAYRATVENHQRLGRLTDLPPIQITVSQGAQDMSIRIRDQGNGIRHEDLERVFEYSYTTVKKQLEEEEEDGEDPSNIFRGITEMAMQSGVGGPLAGLGFGLPLARMYARYFGGSLTLVSMYGYGCDVFLKLRHIDDSMAEGVEI
ncbi:mitochondrial branched-chain alpha-ketoacid dehydrogenase kinase-domain-containing protein [Cokeromyces recurvatus]|uniref:mitochondrial branched-chain alpha-ketoacid dehydrogenase kinase-domain-containing protein n=1 Tax=Cokeromyces recurvatus TaxID=90255 RepID=UPI002220BE2B|nr:mitochondrial branched-chain alpha-ketoacid dehydrogenase kinase-domain-containing protein [Cokeromyces recurvatus]KAI7904210.1 mitochondrial branched-chain alpha-ketoacid dehydrogenase kinase-domain-containing protein [Cokeromyces recurvatus]